MLNNHPVTAQRLRSLCQSAVPGPRVSGAAVPADLWSPALCLRLRLSRHQHTRTADSPDSVPPPLYASSAFKWDSPSGLWWRMWVYFWGELKEELVRRRKAEPGGRIGSFSFSSAPFLLSAGQDSKGRLGETELVWCGSGTFCLARGRAHRLLVSIWSKQELKLVGCVCFFVCVTEPIRSAPRSGWEKGGFAKFFEVRRLCCEFFFPLLDEFKLVGTLYWRAPFTFHFHRVGAYFLATIWKLREPSLFRVFFFSEPVESIPHGACPLYPSVF